MPRYSCLFGYDQHVAEWAWKAFNLFPMPVNMAIGILDSSKNNELVGCAYFDQWNGKNIEFNFYGKGTPTLGIARVMATIALKHFNVERVSIRTSDKCKDIICGMMKFGFKHESIEKHFYGNEKHAVRLVLFRDDLIRLAGKGAL